MVKLTKSDFVSMREGLAALPADVSSDAVGAAAPKLSDIFAPQNHAAALDPATPIVVGARGTGKSFWSGVLGQKETREAAAKAYPNLGLAKTHVQFGFTGVGLKSKDLIDKFVQGDDRREALIFWWATILRAAEEVGSPENSDFSELVGLASDPERRHEYLASLDERLRKEGRGLLVVFDALDTVAHTWARRRILTVALLEVVWMMRAFRAIHIKLFLRSDQIEDDALQFVELPKLRAGAIKLLWFPTDLYGLLFSRLATSPASSVQLSFGKLLRSVGVAKASRDDILLRNWSALTDVKQQTAIMSTMAGPYMASGPNGFKKGKTYDWPLKHLADAFNEVTPRSFIELVISAAKFGNPPADKVITPEGIRQGLRAASKTRVDQLHLEFPWIKGVLAPLDGLLLPAQERSVYKVWAAAKTVKDVMNDAEGNDYLPPFPSTSREGDEKFLFQALKNIGVMSRRKDGRLDMPDLFRVAANLLKKGGTAPLG